MCVHNFVCPKPNSPFVVFVPCSSVMAANKAVEHVLEQSSEVEGKDLNQLANCGWYKFFTHQEKAQIGK